MKDSERRIAIGAVLLAVVSLFGLVLAVPELENGLRDVPRHWWSALPLIGLLSGGAFAVGALKGRRFRKTPSAER